MACSRMSTACGALVKVRLDTDPRLVVTAHDAECVMQGMDYTPSDLAALRTRTHPYSYVAGEDRFLVPVPFSEQEVS